MTWNSCVSSAFCQRESTKNWSSKMRCWLLIYQYGPVFNTLFASCKHFDYWIGYYKNHTWFKSIPLEVRGTTSFPTVEIVSPTPGGHWLWIADFKDWPLWINSNDMFNILFFSLCWDFPEGFSDRCVYFLFRNLHDPQSTKYDYLVFPPMEQTKEYEFISQAQATWFVQYNKRICRTWLQQEAFVSSDLPSAIVSSLIQFPGNKS